MAWYAIDVIQPAVDKTKAFFTGPNLKSKWIKIGILMFIFTLLSGGGGGWGSNFNFSDTIDSESLVNAIKNMGRDSASESANAVIGSASDIPELPNMTGFASMIPSITPDVITFLIIIAIIILIVAFIFGIILTLIKNMAFFAIIESTETNEVHIRAYMKKFWSKAISVTKFEIVVSIMALICIAIILVAVVTFFISLFGLSGSVPSFITGVGTAFGIILIPLAILAILVIIVLIFIEYIFNQFARYWMYFSEMRSFEAFKKSVSLVKNNIAQIIVLLLVQFGLGIVAAIISVIALLVVAIPFVILAVIVAVILIIIASAGGSSLILPIIAVAILLLIIALFIFMIVVSILLAPVKLFFFNYNIMFLQALLGKETTFTKEPKTTSNPNPVL